MTLSDLTKYRLVYLASVYSKHPRGLAVAFEEASSLAGKLLIREIKVFSPIAHTHPIAIYGNINPLDHSFWLPVDEPMMEASDCLLVAKMENWEQSFGIAHEIKYFANAGKPILYLDPETFIVAESA